MTRVILTLIVHLTGLALGAGAASTLDVILLLAVRTRRVSPDLIALLHAASRVVIAAMLLLLVSGLAFLTEGVAPTAKFWAKMVVVAVICTNRVIVHRQLFPRVAAAAHTGDGELILCLRDQRFAATAAAVSAVSWYSALVLGAMRGPTLSFAGVLALYLGVLGVAVAVATCVVAPAVFTRPICVYPAVARAREPQVGERIWETKTAQEMAQSRLDHIVLARAHSR